ncbi:MAG: Trx7/PDZ domain-containing (seleno)protein [Planctomycetota bacterium]|nr:Trx7/PDZ domain-containing (seleno)protein [Planctomycetota bacterium]
MNAEKADHWIYNDIEAGFAEAKKTGKPLFITFGCVPCIDCLGFDGEVADGNEAIKQLAREKFVSVRQVEMKGVDLTRFQFDHDLNWAGMFLNADGTVYARYGTQSAAGADAFNSVKGLVSTMNQVLELHADYPNNKALFTDKIPPQKEWKTPRDLPMLDPKLMKEAQTTRSHCIHCHNIHDAENELWEHTDSLSNERLWRYPYPSNLGVKISVRDGRTITEIMPNSSAEKAGLRAGQEIDQVKGQVITSVADFQWFLHHLKPSAGQRVDVRLADGSTASMTTSKDWKETDISWRASIFSLSPKLRIWMPQLKENERKKYSLEVDPNGLLVKWINRGTTAGKAAVKAGLRNGDVVIAANGVAVPENNAAFNTWVKLNHEVGETLELSILRGGKKIVIELPLAE